MLIVQEILISDDVLEKKFICNLNACKGACCWEGDFGAPLEEEELDILTKIYETVAPYLTKEGRQAIAEKGKYQYFEEPKEYGTTLQPNAACAYMTTNKLGMAKCGIEEAYLDGKIDFKKPISCHLYPIRVSKDELTDFEAVNYDEWDICSAACTLGEKEQVPVYQFLKEPIIRKYGADFYEELDAAAKHFEMMARKKLRKD